MGSSMKFPSRFLSFLGEETAGDWPACHGMRHSEALPEHQIESLGALIDFALRFICEIPKYSFICTPYAPPTTDAIGVPIGCNISNRHRFQQINEWYSSV